MPESGARVPVPVTGSHTSTPQWQSFEVRMRHRRAERCLVRANLAFSAGNFAEARAAIDEAKEAAADFPGVRDMELRLAGPAAELDLPLHVEHARTAHVGADRAEKTRRRHVPVERAATEQVHGNADRTERTRHHLPVAFALAFAAVAMIAAASLGWHAVLQPATPTPLKASLRGDVTLPADPVIDPELDRSNSGAEVPAGADIPAAAAEATPTGVAPAEPSPTSTSGLAAASPSAPLHRTEIVVAGPPAADEPRSEHAPGSEPGETG